MLLDQRHRIRQRCLVGQPVGVVLAPEPGALAFGELAGALACDSQRICIAQAAVAALRDANFRSLADNIECLIEYELSESGQAGCQIISRRRLNYLIKTAEDANG